MPENEDFCLSFELFSWVSDFLSFNALEFFWGAHKKKPGIRAILITSFYGFQVSVRPILQALSKVQA